MAVLCLLVAAATSAAKQPGAKQPSAPSGYTLVANAPGTATLVSPGSNGSGLAVQLTSSGPSGWSAIGFASGGLRLHDVTDLSTNYDFTLGSCWEGSPRFTVGVSNGGTKEIYFYMGSPPSYVGCAGGWTSTSNLATPSSPVDDSHLPGGSFATPYSQVLAKYGDDRVVYIAIDLDGGFHESQTVLFDNTQINGTLYTYEQ